jgi:hypothetical protein
VLRGKRLSESRAHVPRSDDPDPHPDLLSRCLHELALPAAYSLRIAERPAAPGEGILRLLSCLLPAGPGTSDGRRRSGWGRS